MTAAAEGANLVAERPLCSEAAAARGEPLTATASRIEHWLLVEYGGYWPYEPLDAAVFAGTLRERLAEQLAALPHARLLLVKRPRREERDRVRIFFGATPERGRWFRTLELDGHPDLLDFDLVAAVRERRPGEPLEHPLFLVCTHGIRDRCCARYGQSLCRALNTHANPQWVWQASHVGGDRFAGNLVCLPEGLYYGRVDAAAVPPLLVSYLAGQIELERYRGRSCHSFAVQAADARVRAETGLTGVNDLRVLAERRTAPGAWTVELLAEVAGARYEVEVSVERGEPTLLTCRAASPKPPRRFVARASRVLTGA